MASWAFPAPVLPGREPDLAHLVEHIHAHEDDHRESRVSAGVTLERAYLQPTPMGPIVVAYQEATRPFIDVYARFLTSGLKFDAWFIEELHHVHGIDLTDASAVPNEPEQLIAYSAPGPRGKGLAFCAPVTSGKREAARWFAGEIATTMSSEMAASRHRLGLVREKAYLCETRMGDMVCVYLEGIDPVGANHRFAGSTESFDVWFKNAVGEITGVDFSEPLPPVDEIFDWSATPS